VHTMKKDIFNGNIKKEHIGMVKFTLIFTSAIFFAFFVFFLLFALFYEKMEYAARILMFVFSVACFLASVLYPAISFYAIKNYSKHPKLAKSLLKPYVFQDFDAELLRYIIEREAKHGQRDQRK